MPEGGMRSSTPNGCGGGVGVPKIVGAPFASLINPFFVFSWTKISTYSRLMWCSKKGVYRNESLQNIITLKRDSAQPDSSWCFNNKKLTYQSDP